MNPETLTQLQRMEYILMVFVFFYFNIVQYEPI